MKNLQIDYACAPLRMTGSLDEFEVMGVKRLMVLWVVLALVLCGCAEQSVFVTTEQTQETDMTTTQTEFTTEQTEETETTEPTLPPHCDYYLEDVSVEQMTTYFTEVALSMEYSDGEVHLIHKWKEPIFYSIEGDATQEDLAVLYGLFTKLNEMPGFPGIYPVLEGALPNLRIGFYGYDDFRANFAEQIHYEEADGAAQYWFYNDTHEIYDGRIGYRTDIDQQIRNSVILEEIVNLLGLNDTVLREDSIVYQYGSDVVELSLEDWVILRLLYHPDMTCGMAEDACVALIETLYY